MSHQGSNHWGRRIVLAGMLISAALAPLAVYAQEIAPEDTGDVGAVDDDAEFQPAETGDADTEALRAAGDSFPSFSTWNILGPIAEEDATESLQSVIVAQFGVDDGSNANRLMVPEQLQDSSARWRTRNSYIQINFVEEFGLKDDAAAYAYCNLISSVDQVVQVGFGSDDTARIWVNGTRAHNAPWPRALQPGQDRFSVRLKRGSNPCLIKVANGFGGWGFAFSIQTDSGSVRGWQQKSDWQVLGPFRTSNRHDLEEDFLGSAGGQRLIEPSPEQRFDSAGDEVAWRVARAFFSSGERQIQLGRLFQNNGRGVAFAWCDLPIPKTQTYRFNAKADDHIRVWMNGHLVYEHRGANLYGEGDEFYATLQEGSNRCLVQIANEGGAWAYAVRPLGTATRFEAASYLWLGPIKTWAERGGTILLVVLWCCAMAWLLFFRRKNLPDLTSVPKIERRYDIDWIRVIAFLFLILFHVAVFIPNKAEGYDWNSVSMTFVRHWRMPILFVISGMATRFAMSSSRLGRFMKSRSARLLVPMLCWVFLFCPLLDASIAWFQDREFRLSDYNFLSIRTGHLWYIYVIFIYTMIFFPFLAYLRDRPDNRFLNGVRRVLKWRFGIYLPAFVFFLNLFPYDPFIFFQVNAANHALLFLMGFILVCVKDDFFDALERVRVAALIIGVVSLATFLSLRGDAGHPGNNFVLLSTPRESLLNLVGVVNMWSWVLVIFGFGAKFLNRPSPVLTYASDAVFPFYIFHHMFLDPGEPLMQWSLQFESRWLAFWLVSLVIFLACWILYEFVRRVPLLNTTLACKKRRPKVLPTSDEIANPTPTSD